MIAFSSHHLDDDDDILGTQDKKEEKKFCALSTKYSMVQLKLVRKGIIFPPLFVQKVIPFTFPYFPLFPLFFFSTQSLFLDVSDSMRQIFPSLFHWHGLKAHLQYQITFLGHF